MLYLIINTTEDITEQIAIQYDIASDQESEEEEILPQVSIHEAFTALQSLRLFEEQQEDGKALFLRIFDDYEACLINRRCLRRRQQRITSYLA